MKDHSNKLKKRREAHWKGPATVVKLKRNIVQIKYGRTYLSLPYDEVRKIANDKDAEKAQKKNSESPNGIRKSVDSTASSQKSNQNVLLPVAPRLTQKLVKDSAASSSSNMPTPKGEIGEETSRSKFQPLSPKESYQQIVEIFERTDLLDGTEKGIQKQEFWRDKAQQNTALFKLPDVLSLLKKSTAIERGRIKAFLDQCNGLVLNMIQWEAMLELRKRLKFTVKQGLQMFFAYVKCLINFCSFRREPMGSPLENGCWQEGSALQNAPNFGRWLVARHRHYGRPMFVIQAVSSYKRIDDNYAVRHQRS